MFSKKDLLGGKGVAAGGGVGEAYSETAETGGASQGKRQMGAAPPLAPAESKASRRGRGYTPQERGPGGGALAGGRDGLCCLRVALDRSRGGCAGPSSTPRPPEASTGPAGAGLTGSHAGWDFRPGC